MIVYYSPWTHRPSVSEREPRGWIMNWMTGRLAAYQFRELESTERFGEWIFWTNHFNERILEIQYSKKNCRSHHYTSKSPTPFQMKKAFWLLRKQECMVRLRKMFFHIYAEIPFCYLHGFPGLLLFFPVPPQSFRKLTMWIMWEESLPRLVQRAHGIHAGPGDYQWHW